MDEAGVGDRAHRRQLARRPRRAAARARAAGRRSVVALAPAGGWAAATQAGHVRDLFAEMHELLRAPAQRRVHRLLAGGPPRGARGDRRAHRARPARDRRAGHPGRRAVRRGAADDRVRGAVATGRWTRRISARSRIVWGTADKLLPWPAAAARYRRDWLPHADWIELDGVGHCPQVDVPLETAELILGSRLTYSDMGICCVAWPEQRRQRMCSTRWPSRAGATILDLLMEGERPVNDIVARLELGQPQVSKHLKVLREVGLVDARDRRPDAGLPPQRPRAQAHPRLGRELRAHLERAVRRPGRGPGRTQGEGGSR